MSYSGIGYTGNTRGLQVIFRKNRMFMENLKKSIGNCNKKVLGAYAATALDNAISATVQDSSRAAANWNLSFGATMPTQDWDPSKYFGSVNAQGAIGGRGDQRGESAAAGLITGYKAMYYGFTQMGNGYIPTPGGMIWSKLKIGQLGAPPQVNLYNPIYNPRWGRYVFNAFEASVDLAGKGSQAVSLDSLAAGYIPRLVRQAMIDLKYGKTA